MAATSRAAGSLEPTTPPAARSPVWRVVGAAAAVLLPVAFWRVPPMGGLSPQGWHVGLIVLGAALGWLLQPVPDFVVALALAAAWG